MENLQTPLSPLLNDSRLRNYPKGQIIIYQDDPVIDAFVLKQGEVKLYDIDDQGNEKILHILRAPIVFPLSYRRQHDTGVLCFYGALTDVQLYKLPYKELYEKMREDGNLALYVLDHAANEMRELLVRIDSMSKTTAQAKLIAALKFLAVNHAHVRRTVWRRVKFPVSHQLLADMTGMTRESITMAIQQLQQDTVVRYPKQTIIEINFDKLVKL